MEMSYGIGIVLYALIAQAVTEQCLTPNNETAECISLYSCPILVTALASQQKTSVEFFRKSNCGGTGADPMVCCGTSSTFTLQKDLNSDQKKNISKMKLLPTSIYCGYQHADDYFSINSDTSIKITEFPWLARIALLPPDSSSYKKTGYCGGALINPRYVLTVANCITNGFKYTADTVHLGEYNIHNETDCVQEPPFEEECSEPLLDVAIEKIIVHPNYNATEKIHDIALIRLTKAISYSDYIRPICLPFPDRTAAENGDTLLATGWGVEVNRNTDVEVKKKIFSTLISHDECQEAFKKIRGKIYEYHLCTIPFANNTDLECKGDSGGPLMFSYRNQWHLEGMVSFGAKCGLGYPDVHTNVRKYLDWILSTIEP